MATSGSDLRRRHADLRSCAARLAGIVVTGICLAPGAWAQPPAAAIDPRAVDDESVAFLTANGVRAATSRVVVWVPPGTMSRDDAQALAESLTKGVEAIEKFIQAPRPWQRARSVIEYFLPSAMFISHANPDESRVFISYPRIADGTAAFLHEGTHALLYPSQEFLATHPGEEERVPWLLEGVATYVAKTVAPQIGFAEGEPFPTGSLEELDATCARALATPVGAEIAPFIGAVGMLPALFSRERRREVAPVFYGCGASFSKFVADLIGVDGLVDLFAEPMIHPGLERRTGKTMGQLRTEWRERIGAQR